MFFGKRYFKIKTIISSIALIGVILSFSIAAVVLYTNTSEFLEEKITNSSYSNLSQISKKIEMSFSEVENVTKRITGSNVLKEYIDQYNNKKDLPFENVYLTKQINNFLENAKVYAEGIESILLLTPEEHFFVGESHYKDHIPVNYDDLVNSSLYKYLPRSLEKPFLLYLDDDIVENTNSYTSKDNVLVKGSALFTSEIVFDKKIYGIVIIKINDDWINGILAENSLTAIVDGKSILWKGDQVGEIPVEGYISKIENKDEGMIEGSNKERMFYNKLSWGEWYLLYFEDLTSSTRRLKSIGNYIILSFAISLLISVGISKFTLNKLIEPLNNLIKSVRKYKSENDPGTYISMKKDKYSIRERILLYYFMVVIIPLSFFVFSYFLFSKNTIQNELVQSEKTAFHQTSENISLYMERKLKAISSMSYDRTIQNALVNDRETLITDKLYKVVNNYMLLANGYDDISIYNINEDRILSTYNNNKNYNATGAEMLVWSGNTDKVVWKNSRKDELGRFILSIVIKVRGYDLDSHYNKFLLDEIGNIEINLDESEIEQIYRDIYIKSNANTLIVDNQGRVVSSIDKGIVGSFYDKLNQSGKGLLNNTDIYFEQNISGTPWILIGEYDYKAILNEFTQILYYSGFILIIMVLFLIIVSYEISHRIANSLTRFNNAMSDVEHRGLPYEFSEQSHISEISELASTFNEMVTRIDTLFDDLIVTKNKQNRLETEKRDVEIYALQSQIKPHFLCNTLESIRCLIKENKESPALEMLKDLSDLFRFGISKVENLIPIEQELAHAAAYTRIMSKRFINISFKWEIEDETKNYLTPKMVLQPIIENAIYHGIVPYKSEGIINIFCRSSFESICFCVKDNGVGIDDYQLTELNERLKNVNSSKRIGLENVYKRLKLCFGDKADLSIESTLKRDTLVTISIPKVKITNKEL